MVTSGKGMLLEARGRTQKRLSAHLEKVAVSEGNSGEEANS